MTSPVCSEHRRCGTRSAASRIRRAVASCLRALALVACAAVVAGAGGAAWAFDAFVVRDIRVEGVQRTEAGTVFSYLPIKVGDTLNDDQASAAIRALFSTGFFKDVSLKEELGVLVVSVRERPSIASVEIEGVKDFPKDQL